LNIVKLLFELYPNLDPSPRTTKGSAAPGSTPLISAASNGHLSVFEFLAKKESSPLSDDEGNLPIHRATVNGHLSIVSQYRNSVDLQKTNNEGRSPIHLAALFGYPEIFKYVRKFVPADDADTHGFLPIHLAAANGNISVLELYLKSPSINAQTPAGSLPIHMAILNGSFEAFKWLKGNGSNNTADEEGQLPLHVVASEWRSNMIREYQDSPDTVSVTKLGWFPIHLAAIDGHLEAVKALKNIGSPMTPKAEPGSRDNYFFKAFSYTPLELAANCGHEELAMYLIEQGGLFDPVGPFGEGLIHDAAMLGLKDLFDYLLQHDQDPWRTNDEGQTPLHLAASQGKFDIIQRYKDLCHKHFSEYRC
jgi:cytohesin